jgi:hypothetical protein
MLKDPGLGPTAVAVVAAEVATTVGEVEDAVVVVMEPGRRLLLLLAELEAVDPLTAGDCGDVHISSDGAGVQSNVSGEVKSAVAQDPDLAGARVLHGAAARGATAVARVQSTNSKSIGEKEIVHIVEHKMYATLGDKGDKDPRRWVLDTGASNGMMGYRATFASIDAKMDGTVRFGDGSVIRIEGRGTIPY